ncbi:hypothetical protein [Paenibacillus flagellatus]|uniref:Uncharacterized protein n=1 Tax=Paenibacillus flagellatus TaxID=2211139 RepID=A0A2V5K1P8_9BACL|nr:hypothetical protein [Paenibacillus flagellatus]PYI52542.1 hypothetical protein DLM86_20425 [Paenibacillus flagellatus]
MSTNMRTAIKARLAAELPALGGRCYDWHEPTGTTVKPFATVKPAEYAAEVENAPWCGTKAVFEIALYADKSAAADLDALVAEAEQALDGIKLSAGPSEPGFTCRFEGFAGSERIEETVQALVRILRIAVVAAGSDSAASASSADEWLEALCGWTSAAAGADWSVYRQQWPQDYAAPAVLWRIEQAESENRDAASAELRKRMVGHVVGRTDAERYAMVGTLAAELGRLTRLSIDPIGKQAVQPGLVTGDYRPDGLTAGQITVTFRQIVPKSSPNAPLIGDVHYGGGLN